MTDQVRKSTSHPKKKGVSPKARLSTKPEKKGGSRAGSKSKKQSNYLNYKKQLNSYSRNGGINTSSTLKKYFYSNRSINDPSNVDEPSLPPSGNETGFQKSTLRKNVYASLPKKSLNERKASSPGNYSVLTDNFVKIEDSIAMNYTSNQTSKANSKLQDEKYSKSPKGHVNSGLSQYHSQSKKFSKTSITKREPKLPVSRSVK